MTNHIKIYGVKPRIQYIADGNLKKYEFPFAVFKTSDIDVYLDDKLQDQATYSVFTTPDLAGGEVSFVTAPTNGTMITIIRNLSIERTTDFQEGGALRANVLNDEFDYQIACTQQIAENLNRSMVLPPYATGGDIDLTLPAPSAGKAVVWNSSGTALENSTVAVNSLESTLNSYKTAAETAATTASTKAGIASDKADIATAKAAEAASTLASKANKDLDNLSSTGKEMLVNLGMPSETYVDLTLGTSGSRYTMPADGYILFSKQQTVANQKIALFLKDANNLNIIATEVSDPRGYVNLKAWLPVPKNGNVEVQYDAEGSTTAFRFIYAKGEI